MRRLAWVAIPLGLALLPGSAGAQGLERTLRYDVAIEIEPSGAILVTETIVQDFGAIPRHGIEREIPDRFRYDESFDRVYPIELVSVATSPGTPDEVLVEELGGALRIRIGDPDVTVTGRHAYEIVYRVRGAMNGFPTHDELYWNAIGTDWRQDVGRATVTVSAPIVRVACFAGLAGSTAGCDRAEVVDGVAIFAQRDLPASTALTVAVALPPGTVASTEPILEERWSLDRAFARTPVTVGGAAGGTALVLVAVAVLAWRRGRDRRYRGSPIDQVMGGVEGEEQAVPLLERGEGPVEFAPPEGLRPGQIGTLLDERANTLDVTATIVDLAARGHLVIREVEARGWFAKPDWTLTRRPGSGDELLPYERRLLRHLFARGDAVRLSELRTAFAEGLRDVQDALYEDAVRRGWFAERPDRVRGTWSLLGAAVLLLGLGLTVVLALFTHLGLLGLPVVLAGVALAGASRWMPRRTARGTALARRVAGFRRVIETAEAHLARFAEQENVFTRYLPYAIVFGCTEKWAKAFASLGAEPTDTSWYVSSRPYGLRDLGERLDAFSVTTSGVIASTPAASGRSAFGGGRAGGGGGRAGGGAGGGGGGSW